MTSLNKREAELLIECTQIRICIIETGVPHMTASDAQIYNASLRRPTGLPHLDGLVKHKAVVIKALSSEQRRLIIELEDLITKLRTT